jgi:hypothetical protein
MSPPTGAVNLSVYETPVASAVALLIVILRDVSTSAEAKAGTNAGLAIPSSIPNDAKLNPSRRSNNREDFIFKSFLVYILF